MIHKWLWHAVAQNETGGANRGFWSMFPLTKVPFWYWFFEPQPNLSAIIGCLRETSSERQDVLKSGVKTRSSVLVHVFSPRSPFAKATDAQFELQRNTPRAQPFGPYGKPSFLDSQSFSVLPGISPLYGRRLVWLPQGFTSLSLFFGMYLFC